jgi:hypothetical protein
MFKKMLNIFFNNSGRIENKKKLGNLCFKKRRLSALRHTALVENFNKGGEQ